MDTLRHSLHRRSVRYRQRSKTLAQGPALSSASCLTLAIREVALELREEAKLVPDHLRLKLAPAHTSVLLNNTKKTSLMSENVKYEASLRSAYTGYAFFEPPFVATVNLFSDSMQLTLTLEMIKGAKKRAKILAKTRFKPEDLTPNMETTVKLFAESSKVSKCHVVIRVSEGKNDVADIADNNNDDIRKSTKYADVKEVVDDSDVIGGTENDEDDVALALKEALNTSSRISQPKDKSKIINEPTSGGEVRATPLTHDSTALIRRRSLLSSFDETRDMTTQSQDDSTVNASNAVMSPAMKAYEAEQAILEWAQGLLAPHTRMVIGKDVIDLSNCWQDFKLFNLLVHSIYPELISVDELNDKAAKDNLKLLEALNNLLCLGLVLDDCSPDTRMSQTKVQMMLEQLKKTFDVAQEHKLSHETLKAWKRMKREMSLGNDNKVTDSNEKVMDQNKDANEKAKQAKEDSEKVLGGTQQMKIVGVQKPLEEDREASSTSANGNKTTVLKTETESNTIESARTPQALKLMPIESPALRRSSVESSQQVDYQSLLNWVKETLKDYSSIKITNLSSSFQNGLAFCCLLHTVHPDLVPLNDLHPSTSTLNFNFLLALNEFLGLNVSLDQKQPLNQSRVRSLLEQLKEHITNFNDGSENDKIDAESAQKFKVRMRNDLGIFTELNLDLKTRVQELIEVASLQEEQLQQDEQSVGSAGSRSVRNSGLFVAALDTSVDSTMEEISEEVKALEEQSARLEKEQHRLELMIREEDESEEALQQLIVIIDQKNALVRRQMQLNLREKEAIITAKQRKIQSALQTISETSDRLRTEAIIEREQELLNELVALVNEKNELVHTLDSQEKAIDVDDDIRAKLASNDHFSKNNGNSATKDECIIM